MKQILLILSLCIGFQSFSQGCGDAGACSIDAMKSSIAGNSSKNSFKVGTTLGLAQYQVFIVAPYLEYQRRIGKKLSLSAKLSTSIHQGKLATTYDLSDLYLISSYYARPKVKFLAGLKLPFNKANKKSNSIPLPMSYQSTLGTTDLIVGLAYISNHFSYSLAYQKVLIQNSNKFNKEDYHFVGIDTNYLSTTGYQRESDILLRVSYQANLAYKKHNFIYSLLPIIHLGKDSYLGKDGERISIEDSQGLTLNTNVFYQYKVSKSRYFELSVGAPLVARHARPDGLTSISFGIEYVVLF